MFVGIRLRREKKIWDRFKGWKESHNLSVGFNAKDKNAKRYQSGGVALLSLGKISHACESLGADETKLGHWT